LVTSSEDILLEYNIWKNLSKKHETTQLVPDFGDQSIEKKLYNLLVLDSLSIDEMVQSLWWTSSQVSLWISKLELQGYIRQWSWWKYELN
jgi:predicted Rossmann fold nucleotide-binding protein DprA/Smf involved in DNA uptake